jgi:hypothetical protein
MYQLLVLVGEWRMMPAVGVNNSCRTGTECWIQFDKTHWSFPELQRVLDHWLGVSHDIVRPLMYFVLPKSCWLIARSQVINRCLRGSCWIQPTELWRNSSTRQSMRRLASSRLTRRLPKNLAHCLGYLGTCMMGTFILQMRSRLLWCWRWMSGCQILWQVLGGRNAAPSWQRASLS